MFRNALKANFILICMVILCSVFTGEAHSQPRSCDFFGDASIRGVPVTTADVIQAYDAGGQLCGTGLCGVPTSGKYFITVDGDQPETPEDEGAPEGSAITFKINGETATVNGDNTFNDFGSKECHLEIPEAPPVADAGGPYFGLEGDVINFNGSGSQNASTYDWNFGDGTPHGSGVSPTHVYVDEGTGTYTVTLTVTNGFGSDTDVATVTVQNADPIVEAGANQACNEGETLNFSGSATDPGVNDVITGYSWDFDDGGTATGQNSSHTFQDDGIHNVVLTAYDNDGGAGTDNLTVTVTNIPPTIEAGNDKTANEGAVVSFNATATDPGVLDVLTYEWDFGDGGTGSGKNTTHVYGDNGTYNVILTVSDGTDEVTDNLTVTVNNVKPTADAGGEYNAVLDEPITFNGSATDPGFNDDLTYDWDLDGNGTYEVINDQNPTKTYTSTGTVTIRLRVRDDDGAEDIDETLVHVNEGVYITFQTEPSGMQVIVDGQTYSTPAEILLIPNSSHTVEAPYSQWQGEGYRYVYNNWSDGGSREHTIIVPSYPSTYTAYYRLQYYLTIDTQGRGGNPVGEGWYDPGSWVTISIDFEVLDQAGTTRSRFDRWEGTGNGSYSGPSRQAVVTVNSYIVQRVEWAEEYKLDVQSEYGETTGGGWYAPGTEVNISVDSTAEVGMGRRYFFQSWEGDGSGSYTGSDNPAVVTVNGPVLEVAVWNAQYFLDIISEYGEPTGEGWYDEGDTATVVVDTVVDGSAGTRIRFLRWEGMGVGSYTGVSDSFRIVMQGPITETAQWSRQHYLTVSSEWGNPVGEGWYEEGALASFSVDSVVVTGEGERYRFTGWTGTGKGSYTGDDISHDIVIQEPVEETANWIYQYYVSVQVDPIDGGEVSPIAVPGGWADAGETVMLTAVGNADNGYGFIEWSGDETGDDNPLALLVDEPKSLVAHFAEGRVIVDTDPSGLQLRVDGRDVVSPVVYNWLPGESHHIAAISPQGDNITMRYTFVEWSDGGDQEHDILVTDDVKTYTAIFAASYYLNVESEYGTPTGEGWYSMGSQVPVSVDSVVQETEGIRRKFAGWLGTGEGSVTGTDRNITVTVNGPVTEQAQWEPQFRLNVRTYPPIILGVTLSVDPEGPWYDPGTEVTLGVVVTDTVTTFTGWSGAVSDTTNPVTVIVNNPMEIIANFDTPNQPPEISGMPDLTLMEDGILVLSFDWLGQYVTDANDPFEWLVWGFKGESHLSIDMNLNAREMRIVPEANWNGVEEIVLEVTDPVGMSATDTLMVTVISVPDPPGSFELLSPPSDTTITVWDSPMFLFWGLSDNVDAGDEVKYSFYFSPYPDLVGAGTIRMSSITDTHMLLVPQPDGVYYWGVRAQDNQGYVTWCDEIYTIDIRTGVASENIAVPDEYRLCQNFPNPFNPETTIRFQMPRSGSIKLSIFDVRGSIVRVMSDGIVEAGSHEVRWDGKDEHGNPAASGVYFVRMEAGDFVEHRKMILMR